MQSTSSVSDISPAGWVAFRTAGCVGVTSQPQSPGGALASNQSETVVCFFHTLSSVSVVRVHPALSLSVTSACTGARASRPHGSSEHSLHLGLVIRFTGTFCLLVILNCFVSLIKIIIWPRTAGADRVSHKHFYKLPIVAYNIA